MSNFRISIYSRYELPYLAVYLYLVGVMMTFATEMTVFKPLYYIGPMLFIYSFFKLNNGIHISKNIPWYYWVLMFQVLFMWLRFDIDGANGGTFQDVTGAGATILFITMMWNPRNIRIRYLQKWMIIMAITAVLYIIPNWNNLVMANLYQYNGGFYGDNSSRFVNMAMSVGYAVMSCGFLLCIQHVLSTKVLNLVIAIALLGLVVLMVAGRRGYSALMICFILIYFVSSIVYSPRGKRFKRIVITCCFFVVCALYFISHADTQFLVLVNRIDTDSRSDVFYWWNREMGDGLFKWIFGKGMSGGYYDGYFGFVRPGIENGLRHMILKGGVIYLFTYVLLGLRAIWLGLFRSHSRLVKMLALYVSVCIGFLYVWGTPSFSFLHLSMWISFVWIFNPQIRSMTDDEIMSRFY